MALDRGVVLANLNDGYRGAAPDLGALERGCPIPIYGVRPAGMDETNEPIGCTSGTTDAGLPDSGPVPPPDANMGGAGGSSGAAGNAGSGTRGGAGGTAGGGSGGTAGGGAEPDGGNTTGTSGASGTGGAGPTQNQSGCGCTTAQNASPGGAAALCLIALLFRRRKTISAV
jgi:MYXO-CTERM domain-containing protein